MGTGRVVPAPHLHYPRHATFMGNLRYATRPSLPAAEIEYEVTDAELLWNVGGAQQRMPLSEVRSARIFTAPAAKSPMLGNAAFGGFDELVLLAKDGRKVSVVSRHFLALAKFEDRRATFVPFVEAVLLRVAAANPSARFLMGMPSGVWTLWVALLVLQATLALFGVAMVIDAARGRGTTVGLLLGLVFTGGVVFSMVSVFRTVRNGRQRAFDPRRLAS